MIYDEIESKISVAQISFISKDKTIQVLTQGKLLSANRHRDDLNDSEKEVQKMIAIWSAEIYGI
jgi:hypothetical protein